MFFHLGFYLWLDPVWLQALPPRGTVWMVISSAGWVGVEIFFVLSGFVIAYSGVGTTPMHFVRHRFRRLFPTALICATTTSLLLLLVTHRVQATAVAWLHSITFFPVGPWVDGSYWTLSIEITFYALVGLLLIRTRGRYLLGTMTVLGTISSLACLALLLTPAWVSPALLRLLAACWFPPYACLLLVYGVFFALGVLLFFTLVDRMTPTRLVGSALCLAGCVIEVIWHGHGAIHLQTGREYPWVALTVFLFAVCFLIVSTRANDWLQRRLGTQARATIRVMGLTTYPLYLLHSVVGGWLVHGGYRHIGYARSLLLVIPAITAAAFLVATKIEPWVRAGLDRIFDVVSGSLGKETRAAVTAR